VSFYITTALTIGYGGLAPICALGRIDATLPGLIGLLITDLVVSAAVQAVRAFQPTLTLLREPPVND
jgi:hypothetical protein